MSYEIITKKKCRIGSDKTKIGVAVYRSNATNFNVIISLHPSILAKAGIGKDKPAVVMVGQNGDYGKIIIRKPNQYEIDEVMVPILDKVSKYESLRFAFSMDKTYFRNRSPKTPMSYLSKNKQIIFKFPAISLKGK